MSARSKSPPRLSKSRLLSGHRCIRKLWWEVNEPESPELVAGAESRQLRWGRRVGDVARSYFPGGVLIEGTTGERIERTAAAISKIPTLFEASFDHDGVYASADVLKKNKRAGYTLTEVKSTTTVKDEHLLDTAVQTHVLRGAGIDVRRAEVMVLNRECEFPDLTDLFVTQDVTDKIEPLVDEVPGIVTAVREGVAVDSVPEVETGDQCWAPYECPFTARCWPAETGGHPIGELYRIGKKAAAFEAKGYATITDIPATEALSVIASRQRRAVQSGGVVIEKGLAAALAKLAGPVGYLDFETVQLPIPRWAGCHPYDQVPVQFSFHVATPNGVRHVEWIAEGSDDPRPGIARALLDACRDAKTILTYSPFERTVIESLRPAVPALARELQRLSARLVDMLPIVRANVYHPDFHGRFSIKSVGPALLGTDPYGGLEIAQGAAAMDALESLMFGEPPVADLAKLRRDLLAYCAVDTRVMVDVHAVVIRLAGTATSK